MPLSAPRKLAPLGLVLGLALALAAPAPAQAPAGPPPAGGEPARDPLEAEILHARILARLGRVEEAVAAFRALLARSPERALREEYAEVLLELGLHQEALAETEALLAEDPRSARLGRLRARLDLLRGEPGLAAERLEKLAREAPEDAGLGADLAEALARGGRWSRALPLYAGLVQRDPDNDALRAAYREILLAHASRLELSHSTLFQVAATHHTEEVAWKGWLADRLWLRAGARHAIYTQDSLPGLNGFTEEIQTALALLGLKPDRRVELRAGLEGARRVDTARTTLRLGGSFDDGRATSASLDVAVREVLTNPVVAIPLRGATDRLTADLSRRLADRLTAAAHYERRHYRVSGEELGQAWETAGRLELELSRGGVQTILIPQLFFAEYTPSIGSPLREDVSFIRRQDIVAIGILMGLDLLPGLRAQVGAVGRRDLHRAITSWEVTGDGRWQIHPRVELRVLYTRNTEGGRVGGKEESFTGMLTFLH